RRRHTRSKRDWSSDVCSSDLSSFRPTVWWRPLAVWLSLASLTELFFNLLLFIHTGQTALLTLYGTNPPTSGTISYPARIVGTDRSEERRVGKECRSG